MENENILKSLDFIAPMIPAPLYWLDTNSRVLGGNEQVLKAIGGISKNEFIGKTPYEYYPHEIAHKIITHNEAVINTKQTLSQEEIIEDITTGEIKYFIATKSPLFNNEGHVIGIIGTSIEITDTKEKERLELELMAQKILSEQEQKFRKIVDQVVHDIRSPLASMQMIIPACKKLPEMERSSLTKAATRILDIANNLLSQFKPIKNSESQNNFRTCALISNDILEVITEKRYEYKNKSVDFYEHINPEGYFAFLNINIVNFKRMLSNVLNNAVDACINQAGKINVYLDVLNNESVQIIVEDNGCGMPDEVKDKILNNHAVTSGKADGNGIGFGQIQDFLADNEGALDIQSELSNGTKIILTFPLAQSPDWIAQEIELHNNDIVVVLDDDESIRGAWETRLKNVEPNIIRKYFEQGSQAVVYLNGLDVAAKDKVFLLTDYELLNQDLNGLDVVKQTKIKRSILVTSHHNETEVRDSAKLINTKILPKFLASQIPLNIQSVKEQVSKQLKQVDMVLIDDDIEYSNNIVKFVTVKGKNIVKYNNISDFFKNVSCYEKDTKFFIDNQFRGETITGIDIAKDLHSKNFTNLYLFSGTDYKGNASIPKYLTPILKTEIDYLLSIISSSD